MASRTATPSHRHAAVLHTDPFTQLLLPYLDVESIEAFVVFLGDRFDSAACWLLQDDLLWSKLLRVYFANTPSALKSSSPVMSSLYFPGNRVVRCTALSVGKQHKNHHHHPLHDARISSALLQFFAWSWERQWFTQHVVIIKGDADCMGDPDSFDEVHSDVYLRKKGVRALSCDFTRGPDASMESPEVSVHPLPRNAFVIRGRSTQMRSLIHFVSPSSFLQSPWKKLCRTFGSAMETIQSERLRNLAVLAPCPSVFAADKAALDGLREIQRFIEREAWHGTVGIVCYEKATFRAFKTQKDAVLASFDTNQGADRRDYQNNQNIGDLPSLSKAKCAIRKALPSFVYLPHPTHDATSPAATSAPVALVALDDDHAPGVRAEASGAHACAASTTKQQFACDAQGTTQRQELLRTAGQRDRVARVFQTEGISRHVLLLLDVGSVETFVVFLEEFGAAAVRRDAVATSSSCWIFQDEALWSRMLDTHFKVPPTAAGQSAIESSTTAVERTRCKTHQRKNHSMDTLLKHVGGGGCASLVQFLVWSQEREWFGQHVDVIMGDNATKPRLPETDFCDSLTAAEEIWIRKRGWTMMAPGIDVTRTSNTQVRCLIHVTDTQVALQSPWESLCRSFWDAMRVMQQERQKNVAVVVPSAGTLVHQQHQELEPRSTTRDIAATRLREIQRFATQSDWNGQVDIVCYDKQQFRDFQAQKQKLLDAFGSID